MRHLLQKRKICSGCHGNHHPVRKLFRWFLQSGKTGRGCRAASQGRRAGQAGTGQLSGQPGSPPRAGRWLGQGCSAEPSSEPQDNPTVLDLARWEGSHGHQPWVWWAPLGKDPPLLPLWKQRVQPPAGLPQAWGLLPPTSTGGQLRKHAPICSSGGGWDS